MATSYELLTAALQKYWPGANVAPFVRPGQLPPRPSQVKNITDYYAMQISLPDRPPFLVEVETSGDFRNYFSREGSEIRDLLGHHGYWRLDIPANPANAAFWILMLYASDLQVHYLILPTAKLRHILHRTPNPVKFSLFLAKAGFAFAAQPLSTANRLAVLKNPSLLDTAENTDLKMDAYLNNWGQLSEARPPDS